MKIVDYFKKQFNRFSNWLFEEDDTDPDPIQDLINYFEVCHPYTLIDMENYHIPFKPMWGSLEEYLIKLREVNIVLMIGKERVPFKYLGRNYVEETTAGKWVTSRDGYGYKNLDKVSLHLYKLIIEFLQHYQKLDRHPKVGSGDPLIDYNHRQCGYLLEDIRQLMSVWEHLNTR